VLYRALWQTTVDVAVKMFKGKNKMAKKINVQTREVLVCSVVAVYVILVYGARQYDARC